jgi:hypothetical protein
MKNIEAYFQPTVNDPFLPKEGTLWRHSKTGNFYVVIGWARHSEDGTLLVVYKRATGGDGAIWARPEKMWDEVIGLDPETHDPIRRFTFVATNLESVSKSR